MIKDGQKATLVFRSYLGPDGKPVEELVTGTVRQFQTEARYNQVTGEQVEAPETRWELVTDDPAYPAYGFDPDTAQFK